MSETTSAAAATEARPETPSLPETSRPELLEQLHTLLAGLDAGPDSLEAGLSELEREHEGIVHSELIWLLSHLRFTAVEARRHWEEILRHRESMRERLGGGVDLRVALVSYFVEVNRQPADAVGGSHATQGRRFDFSHHTTGKPEPAEGPVPRVHQSESVVSDPGALVVALRDQLTELQIRPFRSVHY